MILIVSLTDFFLIQNIYKNINSKQYSKNLIFILILLLIMNCIIPGLNVKVLARAFHCLAKIGNELFMEAQADRLTFLTFDQNKTSCSQYHLFESFFSIYDVNPNHFNKDTAVSCKIHMKTILPLFKGTNLEKKLEFIKIEYEPPNDSITFKIKYKTDDIIMSQVIYLLDPEILSIDDYSNSRTNSLCAGSIFFNNLLSLFSNSDDEITLDITKTKMIARNYYVGSPHKPKSVRSQVNLNSSEFPLYKIGEETTINFSLKTLRTAILFAETFNLHIGIDFDKGGTPLCITMKNPTFNAIFIVATINPYADGQSTVATTSIPAKITQVNGVQHNLTHEDLEAIANENWDEFDTDTKNASKKSPHRDKNSNNSKKSLETKNNSNKSKGPKKFILDSDNDKNNEDYDYVSKSPESPRTKKARLIFKRSYDTTFYPCNMNNKVLLKDSDSE